MPLRLLPWSPEYGTGIQAELDQPGDQVTPEVDLSIEGPWVRQQPQSTAPTVLQIVDGVRRVEAHALDDMGKGEMAFGLFGSYAVGAVRCEGDRADVLEGENLLLVRRRYLQAGGDPEDREITAGSMVLRFRAEAPPNASTPNDLVAALNRLMLNEEARLAEALSDDESALTLVDGPLRLRVPGRRTVGYVKRAYRWYLAARERELLTELMVGERTPLFRLFGNPEAVTKDRQINLARDRIAWYMRIADLGSQFHSFSGIVRLEVPGMLPLNEAVLLADQCAVALPRLASSPARDPRAPQNLTPVGALERLLTRRLGDRRWVRRLISTALSSSHVELEQGGIDFEAVVRS